MAATPKAHLRTRVQDKARARREAAKARRVCVDAVWSREDAFCEECGVYCYRPGSGMVWTRYGHVHEIQHRSLGGDPTNPANCRLLCVSCHQAAHKLS